MNAELVAEGIIVAENGVPYFNLRKIRNTVAKDLSNQDWVRLVESLLQEAGVYANGKDQLTPAYARNKIATIVRALSG